MKGEVVFESEIYAVDVYCPKCDKVSSYYYYTPIIERIKKTEKCKKCEVKLVFTIGEE
jgi:hypothetical protein